MKLIERIWINNLEDIRKCRQLALDLAQFRNLMLILIRTYKEKYGKWITSESVWYSLIANKTKKDFNNIKDEVLTNILNDKELKEIFEELKQQKEKIQNTTVVQTCLRQIRKDFTSYFNAIKEYKKDPSKFTGKPKPPKPKKLRNVTKFEVEFNKNTFKVMDNKVRLTLRKRSEYITLKLPFPMKVTSVRMVLYHGKIYFDIVYEEENISLKPLGVHKAAIDLGVNNFVTIVSSNSKVDSIVISGGMIKAFNQWFNKKLALYRSNLDIVKNEIKDLESKELEVPEQLKNQEKLWKYAINKLCVHRKKWIDNFIHQVSQAIARYLYVTGHDTVYVGSNILEAKQNCNLGKVNNQNFYFIPFREFIEKLKYKCAMYGIKVVEVDESYTSKLCPLCENHEGVRLKRGLFLCDKLVPKRKKKYKKGIIFNADCVGAFNILKRYSKVELSIKTIFKKLCNPTKFRNIYRFVRYVLQVTLELLRKGGVEGSQYWIKPTNRKLKVKWLTRRIFRMFQMVLNDNKILQVIGGG